MTCFHLGRERTSTRPGNRVTGAGAACRRGFSGPCLTAGLHFTKGCTNG